MPVYKHFDIVSSDMMEYYAKVYGEEEVVKRTYNPDTDAMTSTGEGFVRHLKAHDGRVYSVKGIDVYLGDGDGYYRVEAIVLNDDGSFERVDCGLSGRYSCDFLGSAPDASNELIATHEAWAKEQARLAKIREFNRSVYRAERGMYAVVVRSSRKHKGKMGRITWIGNSGYGMSYRIEPDAGEAFFAPVDYCDVIPDWTDAWGD